MSNEPKLIKEEDRKSSIAAIETSCKSARPSVKEVIFSTVFGKSTID